MIIFGIVPKYWWDSIRDFQSAPAGRYRVTHDPMTSLSHDCGERGIVGINGGRYELLDDGTTVVCLECERTVSLE